MVPSQYTLGIVVAMTCACSSSGCVSMCTAVLLHSVDTVLLQIVTPSASDCRSIPYSTMNPELYGKGM